MSIRELNKIFPLLLYLLILNNLEAQINKDSLLKIWNDNALNDTSRFNALQTLAWDGYLFSLPDSAEYYSKIQYQEASKRNNKKYLASALGIQAAVRYLKSEYEESVKLHFQALKIQYEIKDYVGLAKTLNGIGVNYNSRDINDSAFKYFNLSYAISEKSHNLKQGSTTLNNIGNLFKEQGKYNKALEYYRQSLVISNKLGDLRQQAITLSNIGNVFGEQGNSIEAINSFVNALDFARKIKDKRQESVILNKLAAVYFEQKDIEKAIELFKESYEISYLIGNLSQAAYALSNLGQTYFEKNEFEKAEECQIRSLKINEKINDTYQQAVNLIYLGTIYQHKKKLNEALLYFENALRINTKINNVREISASYYYIGNVYYLQGKDEKALEVLKKSMEIAKDIGVVSQMKSDAELLYKVYKAKGDYKNAIEMHEMYYNLKDSIQNDEVRKASMKAQFQIEFNSKEAEIKTLAKAELDKLQIQANEKNKRKNIVIGSVIFGLVLVSLFAFFVYKSLQQKKQSNELIVRQKNLVEQKQKEVLDSINYAKKIQFALLAHKEFLNAHLPDHFVYFNPKDIVSGDFYWATFRDGKFYLAVCDSTGHGVPGAFMSLLNISFLNEAINERNILEPHDIFNYVRQKLIRNIGKDDQKDGFDGVLLCLDKSINKVKYAAANIVPLIVSPNAVKELDYDRMPVGFGIREESFRCFDLELNQDETLYLFTDGFADQFGGEKGKKFKNKQLKELISSVSEKSLMEQQYTIANEFYKWKGQHEQVDDVCVIGVKI